MKINKTIREIIINNGPNNHIPGYAYIIPNPPPWNLKGNNAIITIATARVISKIPTKILKISYKLSFFPHLNHQTILL
jgi:hypothetical protein